MGPNFMRQVVLLVLMTNPLRFLDCFSGGDEHKQAAVTWGDRCRGVLAYVILALWFLTQLWCDWDHLAGWTPWEKHHKQYFPFPELSMFANGSKKSNYEMSAGMILVLLFACIGQIAKDTGSSAEKLVSEKK